MSGHSKWATIKRDKAVNDAKKSKIFSKLSNAISVAAKRGGGDPDANSTLRLVLEKAREARMPKENIEKAINKGLGKSGADGFEEIVYEGYGPHGVAFLIYTLTDNRNRTVSEIRNIFNKKGGSLGTLGSTAYIFSPDPKNPNFYIDIEDPNAGRVLTELYEELEDHDDIQEVHTNFRLPNPEGV